MRYVTSKCELRDLSSLFIVSILCIHQDRRGVLWVPQWIARVHKMRRISSLGEQLLASQGVSIARCSAISSSFIHMLDILKRKGVFKRLRSSKMLKNCFVMEILLCYWSGYIDIKIMYFLLNMRVFQMRYFDARILKAGCWFIVGLSLILNGGACELQDVYYIGSFCFPSQPTLFRSTWNNFWVICGTETYMYIISCLETHQGLVRRSNYWSVMLFVCVPLEFCKVGI